VAYLEGGRDTIQKHDLAKDPPSRELLATLIDQYGVEKVMNPKSSAFKARDLDITRVTKTEALDLIAEEPNLLKRPLVMHDGRALFGFDAATYEEEFKR